MSTNEHALLSPSAAHRWLKCTPSARLEATMPDNTSDYAAEGSFAHRVCEQVARKQFTVITQRSHNSAMKKLKADPMWNDEMEITAKQYVDYLTEIAMKFDHKPYIVLEVKVDISDYVPEAFGTCDCVMIGNEYLIIADYKHGKGVPVSATENEQLMLYALGALKQYRSIYGDTIRYVTVHVVQPRLAIYEEYQMVTDDLLAWGENIVKPKADLAFKGLGEFVPGKWCRFCRAKARCRAHSQQYTALEDFMDSAPPTAENIKQVTQDGLDGIPTLLLLTDVEIGDLLTRGALIIDWYEGLRAYALATCLKGGSIPGWKAVEGVSRRVIDDFDAAAKILVAANYEKALLYKQVPVGLMDLDKLVGGKDALKGLLGEHITTPPGKPTLVTITDKRPVYSSVTADFAGVNDDQQIPF